MEGSGEREELGWAGAAWRGVERERGVGGQGQISKGIAPWELWFFTSQSDLLFPRTKWTKSGLIGLLVKGRGLLRWRSG